MRAVKFYSKTSTGSQLYDPQSWLKILEHSTLAGSMWTGKTFPQISSALLGSSHFEHIQAFTSSGQKMQLPWERNWQSSYIILRVQVNVSCWFASSLPRSSAAAVAANQIKECSQGRSSCRPKGGSKTWLPRLQTLTNCQETFSATNCQVRRESQELRSQAICDNFSWDGHYKLCKVTLSAKTHFGPGGEF